MKEKFMILMGLKGGKNLVKIIFTLSLLILSLEGYSQGEANIWYFGAKAGLNFNGGGAPTLLTNGAIDNSSVEGEGCSAISDAAGNLLFYTDGLTIYNRNHVAMGNGTGLMGDKSGTQTAIIAPVPGSTTQYYVFTSPVTNGTNQIRYNLVDMTLNAGLGGVTATKNVVMPSCPTYMMEALTSVPTNVAGEYWVIGHRAAAAGSSNSTNQFYAWRITSAGVSATPVVSSVGYNLPSAFVLGSWISAGQGFIKSNTCYTKLFTSYFAQGAAGSVEMHNFDKATGAVSGPTIAITNFDNPFEVYSIEVSPNDRYLYVSELGQTGAGDERVHQFDLNSGVAATINASRNTLMTAAPGAFVRTGHLQLAPDGKIYVSHHSFSGVNGQLGVINAPNLAACNYQNAPAALAYSAGTGTTHGLPQFPRNFVAAVLNISGATSACLNSVPTVSIPLSYTFSGSVSSVVWSTTGAGTFSPSTTSNTPTVTYTTAGTKTVTLQVTDICSNVYTETHSIVVTAEVNSAGTVLCSPIRGNVTSPNGAYTYVWYSDAAGTNPIGTGTTNVSLPVAGTGNVYVKAVSGASSTPTALTNGPSDAHPWGGSDAGATHTMGFTVNKAPLTFGSFEWEAPYGAWAAADQNTTFSVVLRNTTTNTVYYTNNRTVATNGPGWVSGYPFTETVNQSLPIGNYSIVITATAGVGGPIKFPATCSSNSADAEGALTYATSGTCGIASKFTYTYTEIGTTALACSQMSAAIPFSCLLPVEFLSFFVTKSGSDALLQWSTAQEINNNYFQIERSSDGINFYNIGRVQGAGNSSTTLTYKWTDSEISGGVIYYRIKQVDYDGAFEYSAIRYINLDEALSFSMAPNPSNGEFTIFINSGNLSDSYKVEVSNVLGVITYEEEKPNTDNTIKMNLQHLSKGVYLVRLIGNDTNYIDKVVIE